MSYLGLDIGTSGCKAAIFNREGQMLAYAYREYPLLHPSAGAAELDSETVITRCFEVIREVNAAVAKDPVVAMAVSSQGEAFTPVDKDGNALANAMVSSDNRATQEVKELSEKISTEKLYSITGHTPHPLFSLFKLLWLKKHRQDIWKKTHFFLCFEDLLIARAGLPPHISWPLAGRTMLFDVQQHQWSLSILDVLGLTSGQLASPVCSGTIVGQIPAKIASKLGFTSKVTVVAGGHDQPVNALGAGVYEEGLCMYATGTVECFCPMLEKPVIHPQWQKNNLCCYDYTVKGKYTTVAYSLTGGNILKWFRDEFGQMEKQVSSQSGENVYSLLLRNMPKEPTRLLVLPYFCATGTPYFDTEVSGAIAGLRFTTTRGEILKALLEGVAMEMKLNLELMEQTGIHVTTFLASGGGTRNASWMQLKCDVLNRPIKTLEITETGCYGAAMLARSAMENIPVQEIIKTNQQKIQPRIYSPDEKNAALYARKYNFYKELYASLKPFMKAE